MPMALTRNHRVIDIFSIFSLPFVSTIDGKRIQRCPVPSTAENKILILQTKMALKEEEKLRKIKKLAIIALFSDAELMDFFVLKGGNLLDIIYNISLRSSIELDFSIEGEFKKKEFAAIRKKIKKALIKTFREAGYRVFDINFSERPKKVSSAIKDFWGGYKIEFKLIEIGKYPKFKNEIDSLRRNATVVGLHQQRKFKIEISKFEHCAQKEKSELEGTTIYIYSPLMIVFEKLRAICQQTPEYKSIVKTHQSTARARDFLDIYVVCENFRINLASNIRLLQNIFDAKKVPLSFINKIRNYREFHRQDFNALKDTVRADVVLREFDFYFDYVVKKCKELKSLRII